MNIHCSACGAPLTATAKSCTARALPLTAIAMPTPAPVRRLKPIWPYFVAAFFILWVVAYSSDHITAAHDRAQQKPAAPVVLSPEEIQKDLAIDKRYEREIDAEIWNSPEQIRDRIDLLSLNHTPINDWAIPRLQKRLEELHAK